MISSRTVATWENDSGAYCGVFKLPQEILHVWTRDPEEVSQSGSVVSIKVVRNLLEEVGKGDGHDGMTNRVHVMRHLLPHP